MNLFNLIFWALVLIGVIWFAHALWRGYEADRVRRRRAAAIEDELDNFDPSTRELTLGELDKRRALLRELESLR